MALTLFKKEIVALLAAMVFGLLMLASLTSSQDLRRDLDGDGIKESRLIMQQGVIQKAAVDYDLDGVPEMVIQYRNGRRDTAAVDVDHDGVTETWVYFYFTGVPWKVAEDTNGDGRADYWLYLREGKIYKWEQDRNADGIPDIRTVYGAPDKSGQSFDDDYDGVYERFVGNLWPQGHPYRLPGSLAEALRGGF